MALLNRILSGFAGQIAPLPAGGMAVQPSAAPRVDGQGGGTGDTFTRGQWWQNRAAGEEAAGKGRYGVSAYRAQERNGLSPSGQGEPEATGGEAPLPGEAPEAAREAAAGQGGGRTADGEEGGEKQQTPLAERKPNGDPLTEAEKQLITQLAAADTEVRAHEMAHLSAAGPYALGGATFQYQRGPNGKNYAVAGEVGIDTSKEASPQATINKMQTVRAAALAPANPSGQDRRVAASATAKTSEARQELNTERLQELEIQRRANAADRGEAGQGPAGSEAAGASSREIPPGQPSPPVPATGPDKLTPSIPPSRIRAYAANPSGRFFNSLDLVA